MFHSTVNNVHSFNQGRRMPTTLTMHDIKRRSSSKDKPATPDAQELVPGKGTELVLIHEHIFSKEENGTPMCKIRFSEELKTWGSVPAQEAGMWVFFNKKPEPYHTRFKISRIIPSKTACYANPMP